MSQKRVCIVGTFGTWTQTPWTDPGMEIWSLNDSYALGFPRADRWFELHPLDKMQFHHGQIHPKDIKPDHYLRPAGHLEWLKTQAKTIPVYLKDEPPNDWPANARRFPLDQVQQFFGTDYWACGPSYMLALAYLEGYTDIWITGIHLATEKEYRDQRPQWENLIGRLLGPKVKEYKKDGFWFYEGNIRIVMPESCPILRHQWRYAYEPKPVPPPNPYKDELKAVQKEKAALIEALVTWPIGKDKSRQIARLQRLTVIELDIQRQMSKRAIGGTLTARIAA